MNRIPRMLGAGALLGISAYGLWPKAQQQGAAPSIPLQGGSIVAVNMPVIEGNAAIGQSIFEESCASCHGPDGGGVEGAGPPLVHVIYEPSHHSDESFQRAVSMGVRSHHWRFGDMPSVQGLTRGDVAMIIAYIRDVQRANGIN